MKPFTTTIQPAVGRHNARCAGTTSFTARRHASYRPSAASKTPKALPQSAPQPYWRRRPASTTSTVKHEHVDWARRGTAEMGAHGGGGKALLFAGLVSCTSTGGGRKAYRQGSYPHTPSSPTRSSLRVWEEASEALLTPDATIGYWPKEIEGFASRVGGAGLRGWMRDWVEGRTLVSPELMIVNGECS